MPAPQPFMQLATMSRWYVVSRSLHTVAKLGLANHMSTEPTSVVNLAKLTGTKPALLERLLDFLSSYSIFTKHGDNYALTDLSKPLRDDDPYSIRAVLCMVDDSWWKAFSNMDIILKTGKTGFVEEHGFEFFDFLGNNPEKQGNFDQGMAKLSTYDDAKIAESFDFSQYQTLVDLGGGRGGLVKVLAKRYPKLKLILFETPPVINKLKEGDLPKQISLVKGDFLKELPNADAYIFKGVLHDFSDDLAKKILQNSHQRITAKADLFIAEQVLPETAEPHPNKTMDIVMMVLLAGRQRRLLEWKRLIESCGFRFQQAYETGSIFTLMSAKPMK